MIILLVILEVLAGTTPAAITFMTPVGLFSSPAATDPYLGDEIRTRAIDPLGPIAAGGLLCPYVFLKILSRSPPGPPDRNPEWPLWIPINSHTFGWLWRSYSVSPPGRV
jgi:hypothetical protein